MDMQSALLESWDRQCRIVSSVAERIDQSTALAKPSQDGWPIHQHLVHIHQARKFHLFELAPEEAAGLTEPIPDVVYDVPQILRMLNESGLAVRNALQRAFRSDQPVGAFDHPVFFLEILVSHEGWHLGLIFLALRQAGQEPPEAWSESHVWGEWRND